MFAVVVFAFAWRFKCHQRRCRCAATKQRCDDKGCPSRHWRPGISVCRCRVEGKTGKIHCVNSWETIADNLSKAGWSWGCVSAVTSEGRIIWVADAHRCDGKRFVVHADDKLNAFVELVSAIRACGKFC